MVLVFISTWLSLACIFQFVLHAERKLEAATTVKVRSFFTMLGYTLISLWGSGKGIAWIPRAESMRDVEDSGNPQWLPAEFLPACVRFFGGGHSGSVFPLGGELGGSVLRFQSALHPCPLALCVQCGEWVLVQRHARCGWAAIFAHLPFGAAHLLLAVLPPSPAHPPRELRSCSAIPQPCKGLPESEIERSEMEQ